MPARQLPDLPPLISQKLTKTGYTRGATVRQIYQNRVTRNNPVLIRYRDWSLCKPAVAEPYEKGFIVLIEPSWYFGNNRAHKKLNRQGIRIGQNALLLFERRKDWDDFGPPGILHNNSRLKVAKSRVSPLGGNYFARIHDTVSDEDSQIVEGFNTNKFRGAGIRVYEYASQKTIRQCRLQLEALIWLCADAEIELSSVGMNGADIKERKSATLTTAKSEGLLDILKLKSLRILNSDGETCCPLCYTPVSTNMFMQRSSQAPGRETHDLTTTEVSLFHLEELRVGQLGHRPYNLAWGHHHCNVVTKDSGIAQTLAWMGEVLDNQTKHQAWLAER